MSVGCRYIASAACQLQGQPGTGCWSNQPLLTIAIGILQLLLSQLKNLQAARLTSAIGSAACFMYSVLVVVLAATQAGNRKGSVTGYSAPRAEKVGASFQHSLETIIKIVINKASSDFTYH